MVNDLQNITLDDIRALPYYERLIAMQRYQDFNRRRWQQVRKEINNFSTKISNFNKKKKHQCLFCSSKLDEKKEHYLCPKCLDKKRQADRLRRRRLKENHQCVSCTCKLPEDYNKSLCNICLKKSNERSLKYYYMKVKKAQSSSADVCE